MDIFRLVRLARSAPTYLSVNMFCISEGENFAHAMRTVEHSFVSHVLFLLHNIRSFVLPRFRAKHIKEIDRIYEWWSCLSMLLFQINEWKLLDCVWKLLSKLISLVLALESNCQLSQHGYWCNMNLSLPCFFFLCFLSHFALFHTIFVVDSIVLFPMLILFATEQSHAKKCSAKIFPPVQSNKATMCFCMHKLHFT